ncbi:hypothetical protein V1478_006541 [Vespula squamosa]|uniref:Uncharacterized protein n=1 Tax=Vespula squamosa TaxID=30214 RepID=A0ABD2B871_VESSQ
MWHDSGGILRIQNRLMFHDMPRLDAGELQIDAFIADKHDTASEILSNTTIHPKESRRGRGRGRGKGRGRGGRGEDEGRHHDQREHFYVRGVLLEQLQQRIRCSDGSIASNSIGNGTSSTSSNNSSGSSSSSSVSTRPPSSFLLNSMQSASIERQVIEIFVWQDRIVDLTIVDLPSIN